MPFIDSELFIFLNSGSMQIIKIAQLSASPCFTPLSIFIDSLKNPLTNILAVILLYRSLKTPIKPSPNPYILRVSSIYW